MQPGADHIIESADFLTVKGDMPKARMNLRALAILKILEIQKRPATADERAVLVQYVGWGGLPGAFRNIVTGAMKKGWEPIVEELERRVSDRELASLRASTLNAHYTSGEIIEAVWGALAAAVERSGINPASLRVLEPGAGVGHFIGLRPPSVRASKVTAVELDTITGGIAQALYPHQDVRIESFGATRLAPGSVDLVVGNPPFGNFKLGDPQYDTSAPQIHDAIFLKALDALRGGGLFALVTSNGALDKRNAEPRIEMAMRAEFVGAVRLPNTAFKQNAGTEVVTDVIVLRKRETPISKAAAAKEPWTQSILMGVGDSSTFPVNQYFHDNPSMVLGTHAASGSMYRADSYTVEGSAEGLGARLAAALPSLTLAPREAAAPDTTRTDTAKPEKPLPPGLPVRVPSLDGSMIEHNGELFVAEKGRWTEAPFPKDHRSRLLALHKIRQAVDRVLESQVKGEPDEAVQKALKAGQSAYANYRKAHGPIGMAKMSNHTPPRKTLPNRHHYQAHGVRRHPGVARARNARYRGAAVVPAPVDAGTLNGPDLTTFYPSGEQGYTDYPVLVASVARVSLS